MAKFSTPGVFAIDIDPPGPSQLAYNQAVEALRSIDDREYRIAALKGLIAARMQSEMIYSIPDTPFGRAQLKAREYQLEQEAISLGVV